MLAAFAHPGPIFKESVALRFTYKVDIVVELNIFSTVVRSRNKLSFDPVKVIVCAAADEVREPGDTDEITGTAFGGATTWNVIGFELSPVGPRIRAVHVAGLVVKFALTVISVPAELMDTGFFG